MSSSSPAEEHLRVIRSLMEKATVYRAISTQAALAGGVLACLAGGLLAGKNDIFVWFLRGSGVDAVNVELFGFILKWMLVLLVAGGTNFLFLYRDARRRREPFVSAGMRTALRAMVPALLCGAVFTSFCTRDGLPKGGAFLFDFALPQAWMIFYGLALLSTAHFAPGSIVGLGWAFLLSGLALLRLDGRELLGIPQHVAIPIAGERFDGFWTYADTLMLATFGVYHLIYAIVTKSRNPSPESDLSRNPLADV